MFFIAFSIPGVQISLFNSADYSYFTQKGGSADEISVPRFSINVESFAPQAL